MNIPGLNLLDTALSVIASQKVEYPAFADNSINPDGSKIPVYAEPQPLYGSFQPVNNELKKYPGLEMTDHHGCAIRRAEGKPDCLIEEQTRADKEYDRTGVS